MYAFMLLEQLQPRYKPAVLALKAGDQMKDPSKVSWDVVTAFLNAHERSEQRLDGAASSDAGATYKAMVLRGESSSKRVAFARPAGAQEHAQRGTGVRDGDRRPRDLSEVQCWNCDQFGHRARNCPKARSGGSPQGAGASASRSGGTGTVGQRAASPFGAQKSAAGGGGPTRSTEQALAVTSGNMYSILRIQNEHAGAAAQMNGPSAAPSAKEGHVSFSLHAKRKQTGAGQGKKPKQVTANTAWGVDSVASIHVSGNKARFSGLQSCAPVCVEVADGGQVVAKQRGNVTLELRSDDGRDIAIVVENVYYQPKFATSLLSANVLVQKGWELHATATSSHVVTPNGTKVKLDTAGQVSMLQSAAAECAYSAAAADQRADPTGLVLLHQKLGHMGFDRMLRLVKAEAVDGVAKLNATKAQIKETRKCVLECRACTQGKGTRTAFGHRGVDKGSAPGETLHMDTFQVKMQRNGQPALEYGLTISDPHTEGRWFAHLQSKDEAADAVIKVIRNAQTQQGWTVKRLYADGGTEFVNQVLKRFCSDHGIELHYPPARTQQLNGVSERSVRTCKDTARTMLSHASLPDRFWVRAARHEQFVWNRTHVARATGKTPYEVIFQKKPSVEHWGVFGCDAFFHVPKGKRAVFGPKMEPCIYLGHDDVQNCAVVLDLRTQKLLVTRDVEYRETSFAHARALSAGDDQVNDLLALDGPPDVDAISADDQSDFDVERIIAKRVRNGRTEYHVKWSNFPVEDATWEPAAHVMFGASELLEEFEQEMQLQSAAAPLAVQTAAPGVPEVDPAADAVVPDAPAVDPKDQLAAAPGPRRSPRMHFGSWVAMAMERAMAVGVDAEQTPKTHREAMTGPYSAYWKQAEVDEMTTCEKQQVWVAVDRKDLPKGTNVLPVKMVYKIKRDENRKITQRKARLTPKGFRQKEGVDYFEVYARTGKYKTMRVGLSLAAKWGYRINQMDVPAAFLQADLAEDVYIEIPEGHREGREHQVFKLQKSLYGIKQAPRNWELLFRSFIVDTMGFKATVSDPCLYHKTSRRGRPMLMYVFVDDVQGLHDPADQGEWDAAKAQLQQRFDIKDLGESKWILGMRITRDWAAGTIMLDQEVYVTTMLERFGFDQCRVVSTPEETGHDQGENAALDAPVDHQLFMEIVGSLMYAAISTRPDIAHAVNKLSRSLQKPSRRDMLAAERVLRYLAGTKDMGLMFGSRNAVGEAAAQAPISVSGFADADWANDSVDRKSITGWVAMINGDPVSWASKKQRTVSLSTCEAELYAGAAAMQELLWLRGLLDELGLAPAAGTLLHGDNQSAIAVSKHGVRSERTKHVDVKYHFITETVERGDVLLQWIPTTKQLADILTKGLGRQLFERFRSELMTR
jgi:transposase InsO family protein